ncbi:hypothetical protein BKA93DRAFT_802307 [Sparassis latifolia]|uniref:NYN domain-containing protein n=1 Tax=Sparassis crispa TaxID=139825 RepID=A0A401GPV2_9APHY|nr:hypothetical protein SCP_0602430 [Sparassis crispa]GBE84265.1 hypothetical protein SCP_0602430 [Sparassis crispa]
MASDSTFSPTPFSPFSSYSVASGATSDDAPDLGAFTTVFRALNTFQPRTGPIPIAEVESVTPTSSFAFSPSDYDSEITGGSTVWSRPPIASYLSYSSPDSAPRARSLPRSDTDSTASDVDGTDVPDGEEDGEEDGEGVEIVDIDVVDQPSLGLLDEALGFIAAERARFVAQRDIGGMRSSASATTTHTTTASDSVWRHAVQPRRKRRRKKNRSVQEVSRVRGAVEDEDANTETVVPQPGDDDASESSSSQEGPSSLLFQAVHVGLQPNGKERRRLQSAAVEKPRLHHSKSTPTLRLRVSIPFDARIIQLRTLAHKLRLFFPEDAATLSSILSLNNPESSDSSSSSFVDPRGPVPQSQDTLIHVFIDHSNILIGFVTYLKRHLHHLIRKAGKHAHMSHAALALILERGRPITRRVLVASSPLYQPMESAVQLGYEVRVYARVPDTGDGADRQPREPERERELQNPNGDNVHPPFKGRGRKPAIPYNHSRGQPNGHSHKSSIGGGGTSTESEPGAGTGTGATSSSSGNGNGNNARVRYREQGVDELLQLKLHQAIAAADAVPPGATIVLATGDGNVGQFNEEGFLGCVRTALKKGWRVELYAWEGGLSKAWMREFGEGPYAGRFGIHMLDRFAQDLLEI